MEQRGIEATAARGGGKAQALKHVLGLMPVDVFTNVLLPAVSELSWETCPWPDD